MSAKAQLTMAADHAADPTAAEEQNQSNEIVVTGRLQASPMEVRRFVGAVLAETGNDRVARWADRICINVAGLKPAEQEEMFNRIEAVATDLRLEIRGRHCDPSAIIVFTSDPRALLIRLERDRPAFFGAIPRSERDALAASTAPVRWLSWAQLRGANGETPMSFYVDPRSGGVERPVPAVRAIPSRLQTGSRMDLQSMFVVVDVSQVTANSVRGLPAYLAMVVFGNIRQPPGALAQPSILNLFDAGARDGGVATAGLTRWDLSYLRSLHRGNWNMPADRRRSLIQASMARELGAGR